MKGDRGFMSCQGWPSTTSLNNIRAHLSSGLLLLLLHNDQLSPHCRKLLLLLLTAGTVSDSL